MAASTVGPVALVDMPERILRGGVRLDMLIWAPGLDRAGAKPATVSAYVHSNSLMALQRRDWDDHRQIDAAGWGGPRQEIYEMLRIGLFHGVKTAVSVGINVYDWSGRKSIVAMNKWACCGCAGGRVMGAFHAGVEILGREYSFGWNDEGTTGCFWVEPRGAETLFGHRFRQHIKMGTVMLSFDELQALVLKMETHWMGFMYDMWHKNCNHFCDELCQELGLGSMPKWINRLTTTGGMFWDKALWSQRIFDRASGRRQNAAGEGADADGNPTGGAAVARLGASLPSERPVQPEP
jgi:hypothetical protein